MAKVSRDLSTKENRRFWQSVEKSAEEVRAWPAWKRGVEEGKVVPEFVLLMQRRAFLEGCVSAANEELQNKMEEFETRKEEVFSEIRSEIKAYHKKIKNVEKLIEKARGHERN